MTALHASQGGHRTTLTCKKMYIYILAKKILYAKLTYCNHPNKNFEHPNLRITKIWVQKNKSRQFFFFLGNHNAKIREKKDNSYIRILYTYLYSFNLILTVVVLHASQGGHRTTLTCKKKCIYTLAKKILYEILYAKLTYCDHPNKNFEHPNLRIAKICVQKK